MNNSGIDAFNLELFLIYLVTNHDNVQQLTEIIQLARIFYLITVVINVFFYLIAGRFVIFYVIFYTILAAMSLSLWWLFSLTLNPRTPTHLTSKSLIGTNPGIYYFYFEIGFWSILINSKK